MYEAFYGLRERPFALAPDPEYLFLGRHHRRALTLLEYALQSGTGFALVTGRVGCGKTTVVRSALQRNQQHLNIGLIANTHRGFGTLLPWVARAVGMKFGTVGENKLGESELFDAFVQHLLMEYAAGRRVVLLIDEAQNLSHDALEELRVLSNVNTGKDLLLQTVLIGQPELRDTLARRELSQFAQRISVDYHMEGLSREETRGYVRHRLEVAGGSPELIAAEALDLLHARSGGTPRLINQVCDTALVYGFAAGAARIEIELIAEVLDERQASGIAGFSELAPARPHALPAAGAEFHELPGASGGR